MDSDSVDPISSLSILIASMIFILSLVGFLANTGSAIVIMRLRSYRTSFGILSVCDLLSNAGVLLTFFFWAAPTTLTYIPASLETLNRKIGQTAIFSQTISLHALLSITINRFFAITFPAFYRKTFTVKNTWWLVFFNIVLSLIYWVVYFFDSCYFRYEANEFYWEFSSSQCGTFIATYIDLSYSVGIMIVVAVFEFITFLKLKILRKRTNKITGDDARNTSKKHRQDVVFFIQTCSTSMLFAFMFISFHILSRYAETQFQVFLSTTFIWGLAHSGGGIIFILFNSQIRKCLLHPFSMKQFDTTSGQTIKIAHTVTSFRRSNTSKFYNNSTIPVD